MEVRCIGHWTGFEEYPAWICYGVFPGATTTLAWISHPERRVLSMTRIEKHRISKRNYHPARASFIHHDRREEV